MHNYSPSQSQYFVEPHSAAITAASLLGYVSISLAHLAIGIFAHSSRQNCSSSFKLDGFCWCTAIFKLYHRFSIGLRSGLWLGHSKTFKCFPLNQLSVALAVCLGSLSCWKVNLRPSLKSLEDWNRFPSRISLSKCSNLVSSYQSTFFHMFVESPTCLLGNTKSVCFFFSLISNGFFSGHSSVKPSSVECMS